MEKHNNNERKKLLSNFLSLGLVQGTNYILPLITFPYLVKVLGIEYFGLLAFATAIITYFSIIVDYGFNLTATKEISIYRENKNKTIEIFSSIMTIKVLLMIVSFLILTILICMFEKFRNEALVYYLTFGTIIGQILFPVWFFQGMERMKYITYLNIVSKSIFAIAIFIFIQEKEDYYLVPLLSSVGAIISGVYSIILIKKKFNVQFKSQTTITLKYYFIEGWDIFISSFAINFYRNFNILVLGFLTNNLVVGYYSIAEKIIKIIQLLQTIVGNVLFPYFSRKINIDRSFFFKFNNKYYNLIFVVYFIISVIIFLLSEILIYFINGTIQENMVLDLKIMSIVILIGGLNYYYGILGLVSMNYKKEFSKYIIMTGVSNIFFSFLLIYFYKDIGASISLILSEIILFLLLHKKINKLQKTYKLGES